MRLQIKEIIYLLSAMKDVATAHGKQTLTPLQQSSLRAVYSQVFGHKDELQLTHLIDTPLSSFSQVIPDAIKAEYVLRFLVITALMDKTIDREKILTVLDYAKAANIYPHYLNQLNKTLEGDIQWLIKDIMRKNLESFDIFPNIQDEKDIENWLFPYRGDKKIHNLQNDMRVFVTYPKKALDIIFGCNLKRIITNFLARKRELITNLSCPMTQFMF